MMDYMKIIQRRLSTSLTDSCQNILPNSFLTHHFQTTSLILKTRTVPHYISCKRVGFFLQRCVNTTDFVRNKPQTSANSISSLVSQGKLLTRIIKTPYNIISCCLSNSPLCLLPLPKKKGKIWLSPLHQPRQQHQLFSLCGLFLAASMLITWSFHFPLQLPAAVPRRDKNPGPSAAAVGTELWSHWGFIN